MRVINREWFKVSFVSALLMFLLSGSASAEFVFTAPPRETPEQGQVLYGPMADALTQQLGVNVSYQHPGNWVNYQKMIRDDQADLFFDGPHFAAWRIDTQKAEPLVKLPGDLNFVMVSRSTDKEITATHDLVSKKVCALPSPNLGTLTAYSMFPNPSQQPKFVNIKGGFKAVHKALVAGKCDGAIIRKSVYSKALDSTARSALRVLEESPPLTNQGITISTQVDANTVRKISDFLASTQGKAASAKLFQRFSKGNEEFVPAKSADYQGHNLLVDNMVFGW
jgi:ABC-type phosphate/phosphonate transport system substrate-binding protein